MKRHRDDAETREDFSDFPLLAAIDAAERQLTPAEENTIREAFERFHRANPSVYALFERFTLEAVYAGAEHCGAKAVWERLRWEASITTRRNEGAQFNLNNNFTAYYARLFMEKHPDMPDVFRTRKVRS